ncbi:MAG: Amuc_1100 family pilus-like protein [Akkermansiaceae bacterium]|jgi:hypothetical protein
MTWFKENKFLAGLLGITGILAALIIFMGLKSGGTLEERLDEISTKEDSLKGMKGLNPFPTPESAEAKRESLKVLLDDAKTMQEKVLAFRPENDENIAITEFSDGLSMSVKEVKELFPGDKALPERFNLGFETYAGGPPKESATGVLNYQRAAFDWMFRELANAGVQEILNVRREKLPAEAGVDWNDAKEYAAYLKKNAPRPKPTPKGKRVSRAPKAEVLPEIAHRMPFELTFRGPESAVRKFLQSVANSDQYFVEAHIARVKNETPTPEKKKSKTVVADDATAFGPIAGDEPAGDGPATQILNRVSGGEDLTVFLRADLLLFKADQKFPELK